MEFIQGLFFAVVLPFTILAASYIVFATELEEEEQDEEAMKRKEREKLWNTYCSLK